MSTKIVENIYTLPKYLLKKDGTLLRENNNKKTQRRPKNNVNPNKLGTYTVTYNVKDTEGNSAKTATRTVNP